MKYIIKLVIIAFILHIIWENAQAPLYAGFISFSQHFVLCLIGVIGDILITISTFAFIRLFKKDISHTTDYFGLAIIGFAVAVLVEQHALLVGSWNYTPTMPILPILKVGLAPVLQMTLLLPLTFYLAKQIKIFKSHT